MDVQSIFKNFRIAERFKLETRWEMFNALNTVNLNNPNTSSSPNTAGVNTNANFGRIFGALDARRMQMGMHLLFEDWQLKRHATAGRLRAGPAAV